MEGLLAKVDAFQQARPRLAFWFGVIRKWSDDAGGRLAAVVAYYGFFSIFPALLAFIAIAGFVLEDRPELREDIVESALGSFPVVGDSIAEASLSGSTFALIIGLATALWAGIGAMLAAQYALNQVFDVEPKDRPKLPKARAKGLAMLIVFAAGLIGASVLSNVVARLGLPVLASIAIIVATVAINIAVAAMAYKILTAAPQTWTGVLPGAIVAGVGSFLLQGIGTVLVDRYVDNATDTYGTFAVVIGLLTWFHLLAQFYVFGAEINVVKARKLWPRSIIREG